MKQSPRRTRCPACKGSGLDRELRHRYTTGGYNDRTCQKCHGECYVFDDGLADAPVPAMSIASSLITAAEFSKMPDPGHPQELVRGVIVNMPPPQSRHGIVCGNVVFHLRLFVEPRRLGKVFCNDTGVITERDPDSVRGADVMFISFAKLPPGLSPQGYVTVPPDAVFEVRSPSDRWKELHRKIAEYLSLGAAAAYLLDPDTERVHCFYPDREQQILEPGDEFAGVGVLEAFRLPVSKFFE